MTHGREIQLASQDPGTCDSDRPSHLFGAVDLPFPPAPLPRGSAVVTRLQDLSFDLRTAFGAEGDIIE
jgi:hypothetical protein